MFIPLPILVNITGMLLFLIKASWYYVFLCLGPEHWPGLCTTGKRQSPINIATEDIVKTDLGPLKFIRYNTGFNGKITNNGHSGR